MLMMSQSGSNFKIAVFIKFLLLNIFSYKANGVISYVIIILIFNNRNFIKTAILKFDPLCDIINI